MATSLFPSFTEVEPREPLRLTSVIQPDMEQIRRLWLPQRMAMDIEINHIRLFAATEQLIYQREIVWHRDGMGEHEPCFLRYLSLSLVSGVSQSARKLYHTRDKLENTSARRANKRREQLALGNLPGYSLPRQWIMSQAPHRLSLAPCFHDAMKESSRDDERAYSDRAGDG
jgi:hypothetical protein